MSSNKIHLGKLSIAILENYVEKVIGNSAIQEIKAKYVTAEALENALTKTETRFIDSYQDKELTKALFIDLSTINLPSLEEPLRSFQENPTSHKIKETLVNIIKKDFPSLSYDRISNSIEEYVQILTEELAQTDSSFREKATSVSAIRGEKHLKKLVDLTELHNKEIAETQTIQPKSKTLLSSLTYSKFTIQNPPKDFVGRTEDLLSLRKLMEGENNAVLISGKAGVGKTVLARKFAHQISSSYSDARLEIDFHAIPKNTDEPNSEILRKILAYFYPAQSLPDDYISLLALYKDTLSKEKVLFLFDNVAVPAQISDLIPPSPSAVIITSRTTFSSADKGLVAHKISEFNELEAFNFLQKSAPRLQNEPVKTFELLSKSCGYLPLGLRIIAALLEIRTDWSPNHLVDKLSEKRKILKLLRVPDDEELNIKSAINLSYESLDKTNQRFFREVGIFTTSFFLDSAAEIWDVSIDDADEIMGDFIRYNLVDPIIFDNSETLFYKVHDLIGAFAYSLLETNKDELETVFTRYAEYYIHFGAYCQEKFNTTDDIFSNIFVFDTILPHLESIHKFLQEDYDWNDIKEIYELRRNFAGFFCDLLNLRFPKEKLYRIYYSGAMASKAINDDDGYFVLLNNLGTIQRRHNDFREAFESFNQCLEYYRSSGNSEKEVQTLGNIANTYSMMREFSQAIKIFDELIKLHRKNKNYKGLAFDLINLGGAFIGAGKYSDAIYKLEDGLRLAIKQKDMRLEAYAYANLGIATIRKASKRTSKDEQIKLLNQAHKYSNNAFVIANSLKDLELLKFVNENFPWEFSTENKHVFRPNI